MSDEELRAQRRLLEREARYSERLTAFLTCMRDGHDESNVALAIISGGFFPCPRCGLTFWKGIPSEVPSTPVRGLGDYVPASDNRVDPRRCRHVHNAHGEPLPVPPPE